MSNDRARATDADRDYFRRLGEWEAENDRLATEQHLALSIPERLAVAWRLWLEVGHTLHPDVEEDNFAQIFNARAKERGLYRDDLTREGARS